MGAVQGVFTQDERIFQNLTVDDLYNPNLTHIYSVLTNAAFPLSTFTYAFASFVVLTKSTRAMGDYKYLLLTQLTWSYLFELVKFAWKPVVLWPLKLAYSIGFIDFGPTTVHVMFPVDIFIVYGMGVSLALCLFYRISKIFDQSFLDIFFKNKRRIAATYLIVYVASSGHAAGLVIAEGHNVSLIRSTIISDVSATAFFFDNFTTAGGYSTKLTGLPMTIFIASTAVTVVGIVVFFVLIHYLIQRQFRKYMRCLSVSTLRLQRMLYRALCVQILVILLFLFLPLCVLISSLFLRLRNGAQFALLCITMTTFHMIVDAVVLLYFVRPYREYVYGLVTCGRGSSLKESVISVTAMTSLRINSK